MRRRQSKKRFLCLAAAAAVLSAGVSADRAMAYFTDCVSASGSASVSLKFPDTEIHETKGIGKKVVVIENTGECGCFVRVRAYMRSDREPAYQPGDGWVDGQDGYYYYDRPLSPAEQTGELQIEIPGLTEENTEEFNVIVVNEHTFELYDADGNPNWRLSWGLSGADQEKGE